MVKKKLAFVFGVFCATVLLMAVQKPVFLAYYAADAAQASAGEWLGVVWHGLTLDSTVAGYVTALPLLLTLASLWVRLPERIWRRVLNVYFVLIAVLTAAIFAVDVELYRHWGFRLDSTVLIYLADPKEAMASVDFWLGVRQTLLAAAYVALMIWTYRRVMANPCAGAPHCRGPSACCCLRAAIFWRSAAVRGHRSPMSRKSISARTCS